MDKNSKYYLVAHAISINVEQAILNNCFETSSVQIIHVYVYFEWLPNNIN
jgi:hypothetical protein